MRLRESNRKTRKTWKQGVDKNMLDLELKLGDATDQCL